MAAWLFFRKRTVKQEKQVPVLVVPSERKKSVAPKCLGAWSQEPGYRLSSCVDVGDCNSPKYPRWNREASG